ncbi:DUF1731 domain-containing protein [Desulfopila inferna]|uniref:DUF1731 domain-containing protein n=1 Tax=Desulfopila inferna TaxID=468528 RepID=UPI00196541E3|nr:DUF1731 domain-containing protein [Desulfopila inferna]MBM9603087.1 DUF1731 domain-containing protein [Desulfopila inferna]
MNVFISGSSSILASALIESYFQKGCTLFINDEMPEESETTTDFLEKITNGQHMDLVLLLHGEDFLTGGLSRSNLRRRAKLQIQYTTSICQYFSSLPRKPQTILLGSSALIYQQAMQEMAVENSPAGGDFPADLFQHLESSTRSAEMSGIRVLHLRFGQLVSRTAEPAFPRLPLFRHFVPSVFQESKCMISWVSQEDAIRAIAYILQEEGISSPVNITSGDVLPRSEFFKTAVAKFNLRRTFPLPASLIRLLSGREAADFLKASTRVIPLKLMESGFLFEDISLQEYLLK